MGEVTRRPEPPAIKPAAEERAAIEALATARRARMRAKRVAVEEPATSRRLAPEQRDVVSAALAELNFLRTPKG